MKRNNLKMIDRIYGKDFKFRKGNIKHCLLKMGNKYKNLRKLLKKKDPEESPRLE